MILAKIIAIRQFASLMSYLRVYITFGTHAMPNAKKSKNSDFWQKQIIPLLFFYLAKALQLRSIITKLH